MASHTSGLLRSTPASWAILCRQDHRLESRPIQVLTHRFPCLISLHHRMVTRHRITVAHILVTTTLLNSCQSLRPVKYRTINDCMINCISIIIRVHIAPFIQRIVSITVIIIPSFVL
ncbi:hypothetical protein SISNIDRAFT_319539 [Sistotremastrum niveocremeum HHB9708]|uniref:Uncharacterized protein n=1 Tax=Sistotremastrum niveocremeum HHB9708 TaxID=1314777 RepID=A0A164N1R5_9AGAM|nr:hypothetical protein SISNIDRAFT_319539 [Sistotremastrum niveocremeum HHB9708]